MSSSREPDIFAIETLCDSESVSLGSLATRYSATDSRGSIVALIPILCTSVGTTVSISAIDKERWVPLFVGTRECISSIMIHRNSWSNGLNRLEARASPNDSGVVIKI